MDIDYGPSTAKLAADRSRDWQRAGGMYIEVTAASDLTPYLHEGKVTLGQSLRSNYSSEHWSWRPRK